MKQAASFLNKLAQDSELQKAMKAATQGAANKEEKIAATVKVANEAGFEVSPDELQKLVEAIQQTSNVTEEELAKAEAEAAAENKDEAGSLSDEELEIVSGGWVLAALQGGAAVVTILNQTGLDKPTWNWMRGAGIDTANWSKGAYNDSSNWVSGAANDTSNWVSGAGNTVASAFSGW